MKIFRLVDNERGAALVVGLLILVVLTLLGISAMKAITLQEKMAGNMHNRNLAFHAAEAALRDCETVLMGAVVLNFNNTKGLYSKPAVGSQPRWETISWNSTDSRGYSGTPIAGIVDQPRCIIEEFPVPASNIESLAADEEVPMTGMYRITARGLGATRSAVVILQSTYLR